MKYILLLIVSSFLILATNAQGPAFTWSPAHTKPSMKVDIKLFGNAAGYYIVNRKPASGMEFSPTITVEYFDGKQDRVFTKDVTPSKAEDLVDLVYFDNKLYLLSALFNKESGKNVLSAKGINIDGTFEKPVELGTMSAEKLSARGRFNAAASPDGSKLFVIAQPEYVKDQNEQINVALFTKGFANTWKASPTFNYPWSKAVDNTPYVNNQGTGFIIKKVNVKGVDDFYSIFSVNGTSLKEYKTGLDGKKKVATIVQSFAPDGDFTAAGYYTEDGKIRAGIGTALHGSFLQRIDNTGAVSKISVVNPFEKRKDIVAKDIVFHDNITILLGERYYVSERAAERDPSKPQTNEQMFARDYSYYGMDIQFDGFDVAGKPVYHGAIEKDNNSKNDNGTWVSYFAAVINGKLHIIFNDDKYRYDEKKKVIVFGSNRIVVAGTVDPATGVIATARPVLNTGPVGGKEGDMLLRPDVFLKLSETEYIIRAENPTIYRMGLVKFGG